MALADFAVSKRRSSRLASEAIDQDLPETGRARILNNAILDLRTESDVVDEVAKLWIEAQEKFLSIGRYLLKAKIKFAGSFESHIVANLPFGKNIAYQLRMVAEAVDSGRLPEQDLPRSYATAFQLVSLPAPDFDAARAHGLVRNTVTRPEVNNFRRELRAQRLNQGDRRVVLSKERDALRTEIQRIQVRYREVEARLAEILAEIGADEDINNIQTIEGFAEP
jgi:transposase-like protein